jgi:signal transduction histidine kinase
VYALRDVTGERSLERARSEFVATASHELRTPVAAIYGAARTLRRPDLQLPESTAETLMRIVEEEAERLAAIVEQFLLVGRLDSGELGVSPTPCDVSRVVESVLESMALRVPAHVSLRLRAASSVLASCDADRFRQVLQNLVENALKYSPGGGTIEVVVGQVDGRVRVEVRDEGLGIPPGDEERIFEKFVRLDPALTQGIGGTGLGLYIARELVERMNGRIWVERNGTLGSCFVLELPVAASIAGTPNPEPAAARHS